MTATYRLQTDRGELVAETEGTLFTGGNPKIVTWGTRTFVFHEFRVIKGDTPLFVYREAFAYALVGLPS